jgi:hypothetical protein
VAAPAIATKARGGAPSPVLASVKRNIVAIISLVVALAGLGYNTWRNESTEAHRNVRQGAFAMLEQLGQLQQLVDQRFYADKKDDVNRITCWGKVALHARHGAAGLGCRAAAGRAPVPGLVRAARCDGRGRRRRRRRRSPTRSRRFAPVDRRAQGAQMNAVR